MSLKVFHYLTPFFGNLVHVSVIERWEREDGMRPMTRLRAIARIAGTGEPDIGRLISAENGRKLRDVLVDLPDLFTELSGEVRPSEQPTPSSGWTYSRFKCITSPPQEVRLLFRVRAPVRLRPAQPSSTIDSSS